MPPKRIVKTLSLGDKVKIINEIDAKKCKKMDVARKYGIPSSTLSTIYKNRDRILKFSRAGTELNRKRMKPGKFPELEEEIWKWILSMSGQNATLSGTTIRKRAQWLAEQQDYTGFNASVGWLEKFRARHKLKTVKKKIVLPTETSLLTGAGTLSNEEFILPGSSPQNEALQRPSPPEDPKAGSKFPCTAIKQEPVLPDEYDWTPHTANPSQSGSLSASASTSPTCRTVHGRSTGFENDAGVSAEIEQPLSNSPSENRATRRPPASPELLVVSPGTSRRAVASGERERAALADPPSERRHPAGSKSNDCPSLGDSAPRAGQPKDQLECFGNYIVSRLKQMDTTTCLLVQKAINDVIFEAEIKKLTL